MNIKLNHIYYCRLCLSVESLKAVALGNIYSYFMMSISKLLLVRSTNNQFLLHLQTLTIS